MALTKPTMDTNVISILGTTSADRGLTEDQFKAKFDETPAAIVDYLTATLTAELDTALGTKQATLTGLTATPTELNVLDGIPATLTATELGHCDGVTSAIQTQLDSKVVTAGDTFEGVMVAQANTTYTTAQIRNVIESTGDPAGGNNGDIWIKYTA